MLLEATTNNIIENPNYGLFNAADFFGFGGDAIRLVVMLYIFFSFLLNLFIFFTIFYYKSNKHMSFSGFITCNILIINFLHTLSYIINWVLKDETTKTLIDDDSVNVGALLSGNPSNYVSCSFQGVSLIFLSLSQEILNNLLLGFIIFDGNKNKPIFILVLVLLGYIFPACLPILFLIFDLIGINEKYCFIAKYMYDLETDLVKYKYNYYYDVCQIVFLILRILNFIVAIIFLIMAIKYIYKTKDKDIKTENLISSFPTAIVIFFTSGIDIIFRIIFVASQESESQYTGLYLILNTVDSLLLPLSFIIVYKLYKFWFYRDNDKDDENKNNDLDTSIQDGLFPQEQKEKKNNKNNKINENNKK